MVLTVVKRDGRIVGFNEDKIAAAIRKAMLQTEMGEDQKLINRITDHVVTQSRIFRLVLEVRWRIYP